MDRKKAAIVLLAILMVLTSCGGEKHQPALLDSMPSGYDVYVTFSPSEIGIETVLESMGELAEESHQQLPAPVAGALGFDPFLWEGWVDALALDPAGEAGLVVNHENDEPELIALFIPSTDPDRVRGFVETAMWYWPWPGTSTCWTAPVTLEYLPTAWPIPAHSPISCRGYPA